MADHSKKVLVIGADSFTGRHLSPYLQMNGYDVYGTGLKNTHDSTDFIDLDILDNDAIRKVLKAIKPSYIINLAAASFVGENNKELFYQLNVIGTENILNAIKNCGLKPKKVILPSSAVVYGDQKVKTLSENLILNPKNHYGYSKYVSELICKSYFSDLDVIIPRPFNYTGRGQRDSFLIPKIVSAFKTKQPSISLGNLDTYREYNDVKFVCECYLKLMESNLKSLTVNICTGVTYSAREIVNFMESIAGYKITIARDERFIRKNEIQKLEGDKALISSIVGEINDHRSIEYLLREMYFD